VKGLDRKPVVDRDAAIRPSSRSSGSNGRLLRCAAVTSVAVLVALILGALLMESIADNPAIPDVADPTTTPKISYTSHAPISIPNNSQFTSANGVVRGNGTANNPYVIEGWDINATGIRDNAIEINAAIAYFEVRNCRLYGANISDINIRGSRNGALINNSCSGSQEGIFLWLNSRYITIIGNKCENNSASGIYLSGSSNVTIIDNYFANNDNGIYLVSSRDNLLSNNTCRSNSLGMLIANSDWNVITHNNLSVSSDVGIRINPGSDRNRIWNNTFYHNNGTDNAYDPLNSQAFDANNDNYWNTSGLSYNYGNYWMDMTTPDLIAPWGIVDKPYSIAGGHSIKDYFPLCDEPVPPIIPEPPIFILALLLTMIFVVSRRRGGKR